MLTMQGFNKLMKTNIFFLIVKISIVYGVCRFPDTLYGTEDPWKVQSEDGTPNYGYYKREVTFQGSDMKVDYITSFYPRIFNKTKIYRCEEAVGDNMMYTVSVHEENKDVFYTCVQFIIRGTNVIQWKMTPLTKENISADMLCFSGGGEERLKLMDSPFIYHKFDGMWSEKRNRFRPYVACPLDGGYAVMGWHNESGQQMCNSSVFPLIKVENECENGEGLLFRIYNNPDVEKYCPIPGDKKWHLYCSTHWVSGPWTFMLAIHRSNTLEDSIVCLRYPTDHGDSMTLDIFRDSICDSTEDFETSLRRYHVDLKKQPAPSICDDQYPTCEQIQNISRCQDFIVAENCLKTCSTCRTGNFFDEPQASFPPSIIGDWLKDTNAQGEEIVSIKSGSIEIPSLGIYKLLGKADCLSLLEPKFASVTGEAYMLLQTKSNGCTARATTMAIGVQSVSVISLRIYDSMPAIADVEFANQSLTDASPLWWVLEDNRDMWCPRNKGPTFRYELEAFRTSRFDWFNLITTKIDAVTVPCPIPSYSFIVKNQNSTHCAGELRQMNANGFELTFSECNGTKIEIPKLELQCLADFSDRLDRRFIITKSTKMWKEIGVEEYVCWAFPEPAESGTLYWMHVSECDGSSIDFVNNWVRKELSKVDYEITVSMGSQIQSGLQNVAFVMLFMLLFI